ncbi:MAG: hypothetical protein KDB82_11230 [Planctomycetes bacterium]|nr:hypothetical protein [Planctomycetota bacterium]
MGNPRVEALVLCKRVELGGQETRWSGTLHDAYRVPHNMAVWMTLVHVQPFAVQVCIRNSGGAGLQSELIEVAAGETELVLDLPLAQSGLPPGAYEVCVLHGDSELKGSAVSFKEGGEGPVQPVDAACWLIRANHRADRPDVRFNPLPKS